MGIRVIIQSLKVSKSAFAKIILLILHKNSFFPDRRSFSYQQPKITLRQIESNIGFRFRQWNPSPRLETSASLKRERVSNTGLPVNGRAVLLSHRKDKISRFRVRENVLVIQSIFVLGRSFCSKPVFELIFELILVIYNNVLSVAILKSLRISICRTCCVKKGRLLDRSHYL